MYVWEPHEDIRLKGIPAVEVYMPSWAKERGRGLGLQRGGGKFTRR